VIFHIDCWRYDISGSSDVATNNATFPRSKIALYFVDNPAVFDQKGVLHQMP